jgi:hypothetical protein
MPAGLVLAAALAVGGSARVDEPLLAGLATVEATLNVHGEMHRCSGPSLAAVVARLGLPGNEALRGAALQRGIMIRARDGYAVLFSLGEIDPGTGAEPAIIATQCDGKPIGPEEGPYRLVVPNDKCPTRSIRQVESIELR